MMAHSLLYVLTKCLVYEDLQIMESFYKLYKTNNECFSFMQW